jgi:hypothetical protein
MVSTKLDDALDDVLSLTPTKIGRLLETLLKYK